MFISTPPHSIIFVCSQQYVESIVSRLPTKQLHLSTSVDAVLSREGKMRLWAERLWTGKGGYETFDHIIFACHADDALRILNVGCEATHEE